MKKIVNNQRRFLAKLLLFSKQQVYICKNYIIKTITYYSQYAYVLSKYM